MVATVAVNCEQHLLDDLVWLCTPSGVIMTAFHNMPAFHDVTIGI